jgi:hypothetical protein
MPQHVVKLVIAEAIRKKESCPISCDDITEENATVTSCGHVFTKFAIKTWLETPSSKNPSSTPDRYAWRQPRKTRNSKKKPSADDHFQEVAKETHARNKKISNPYEHEDTEQYSWALDSLLSDEKKDLVKRSKR